MDNFKKTVMPGRLPHGRTGRYVPFHIGITHKDGTLSISGVVGASPSGNCSGSCGQNTDNLKDPDLRLAEGWTQEMVDKLYEVWDNWHLNDMVPYCEHQKELGWRELAREKVNIYHWRLNSETILRKQEIKKAVMEAISHGFTVTPTAEQSMLTSLDYALITHTEEVSEELKPYYIQKKPIYNGDTGHIETKLLGWIKPNEHPDGILCKPCPVCEYKYGSAWKVEEVPEDVLEWLYNLPPAEVKCAWGSV